MYDLRISESPAPRNAGPIAVIVLSFTVMGCCLGIMLADQEALSAMKAEIVGLIPADMGSMLADFKAAISGSKGETASELLSESGFEAIATGLSPLDTIHYSSQADSAQMIFELEDMQLIGTGTLSGPDRIYIDFLNNQWKQDSFKGIKTLKAIEIGGNLVSRVRLKRRESGVLRIVLDLQQCCDFTYDIPQKSPSRLIVRIQPV